MKICNLGDIKAVAFDIDGTLYREPAFFVKMFPHFITHSIFFLKFGLVRKDLRKMDSKGDFYQIQAELMAKKLKCPTEEAKEKLNRIVYDGLKKYYKNIKPCKGVVELIDKLLAQGLKIAILSDFPPEQKGEIWGIKNKCHVVLGTEESGALKPADLPFKVLAERLELPFEEILYVGNNHKYDIEGPKKLGMKAAWFTSWFKGHFGKSSEIADFTFCSYKELENYIFNK